MAVNFSELPVRYGMTKYGGKAVLVESQQNPGFMYIFSIKKPGKSVEQWKCSTCSSMKLKNKSLPPVPFVRISNDQFLDDPDRPLTPHYCTPPATATVEAYQIHRESKENMKQSRKRPREAYQDSVNKIARTFGHDHVKRDAVLAAHPTFAECRSSYYRTYNDGFPTITSISDIPQDLKFTYLGATSTDPTDAHFEERLLQFVQEDPPFLIMASSKDIENLHASENWIMDGTFSVRPSDFGFSQLYVIMGFKREEGLPCFHALTPSRNTPTYMQMFRFLRTLLIAQHGNIGSVKYAHIDFEDPAINAFRAVFPEVEIKGCLFHYTKCLNTNVQQKGLQSVYHQNAAQGFDLPQFQSVRAWVRRLAALPLLPIHYVRPAWDRMLSFPPVTGNAHVDQCLLNFKAYFEREWMTAGKIQICNHFDHSGPRTTNHSEGYNNKLRDYFQMSRPRLSVFLVLFQGCHNVNSHTRSIQLDNGAPPNPRLQQYIQNDINIARAKLEFIQNASAVPFGVDFGQYIDSVVLRHLDTVQHYLCGFDA